MRNLAKICAVVVICLGAAGSGWATDRSSHKPSNRGRFRPMVVVSVPGTPLNFGVVSGPGPKRLKAEVTAHVVANCPFRLAASFDGLKAAAGQMTPIPAAGMVVTINGKQVQAGTKRVVIATGGSTPAGGVDVPVVIEMEVKGVLSYPAGRYGGNLALIIMPGS